MQAKTASAIQENLRIVIHAGRHKTGTSSIQAMLAANEKTLASEYSIYYPPTGRDPLRNFHHSLFRPLIEGGSAMDAQRLNEIYTAAEEKSCHTVLLSSEMVGRPHLTEAQLGAINDAFEGRVVSVILYFREQAAFLESMYANKIRMGLLKPPETIHDMEPGLDYLTFTERFEHAFGKSALHLRSYELACETGIINDFLSLLNVPENSIKLAGNGHRNVRAPWRYVACLRQANRWRWSRHFLDNDFAKAIAKRAEKLFPRFMNSPRPLTQEQKRTISLRYEKSNNLFKERYAGQFMQSRKVVRHEC